MTGTLLAGLSVWTGLYLAPLSSYEEVNLFWHKWSGIALTAIGLLLYFQTKSARPKFIFPALNAILLLMLTITGHLGGKMTHGPDYLFPAVNTEGQLRKNNFVGVNDSTELFKGLYFPYSNPRCLRCHQPNAKNGGYTTSLFAGLKTGSPDGGQVMEPGQAGKSELFKRVSLPANHPRFMPPNGLGLSYDEIRLIGMVDRPWGAKEIERLVT